jgi:DNA mismatch repair protein MutL
VLERSVADRIAAGEVVERPASVVKELVENSLDAGAHTITVEVEGAGLRLIRVADDGAGITPDEVRLAFERFATSKIERLEDLDAVETFGFRGEALPSIGAVARVVMTTRPVDGDAAVRIVVVGGAVESVAPHGAPAGTTVEVARLFHNTPARMKFLKSPAREQALIADAVQRAAMAHPGVGFRLALDGREAGFWPPAAAAARVADLLADGRIGDLVEVRGRLPGGTLGGWLARPERGRPNRAGQHVFVNRRPVASALLRRAVEQGYAQLLPVGRFPAFAIFVEMDPALVDVNVHPRKLEVRFRDESALFGAVAGVIRDGLLSAPLVRQVPAVVAPTRFGVSAPVGFHGGAGAPAGASAPALETREAEAAYAAGVDRLPSLRPLGQVLNTYIAAEGPDGLYLIDQHAAHERVVYERLLAARRRGGVTSQMLAVPLALDLTPGQMSLAVGHADALAALGYGVEPFGARTLLVRAVPVTGASRDPEALLRRAIGALAEDGEGAEALERLTIATACHTAVRAGDRLTSEAAAALLADLAAAEDPFTCFHGRPTVIQITRDHLERWFLRG